MSTTGKTMLTLDRDEIHKGDLLLINSQHPVPKVVNVSSVYVINGRTNNDSGRGVTSHPGCEP